MGCQFQWLAAGIIARHQQDHPSVIPALVDIVKGRCVAASESDAGLRWAAAMTLAVRADGIPLVAALLRDPDPLVSRTAAFGLGDLAERLQGRQPDLLSPVQAVGAAVVDAIPILEAALDSGDEIVRCGSFEALAGFRRSTQRAVRDAVAQARGSPPCEGAAAATARTMNAQTLWDQAVAAKGGRTRLRAVRSLVTTSVLTSYRDPSFRVATQRLYVFPSKRWQLVEFRPGNRRSTMMVFDLDRRIRFNETGGPLPWTSGQANVFRYEMVHGQFMYLLESDYFRPRVTRARAGQVNARRVDMIETIVSVDMSAGPAEVRVEYALDRQTHLPIRMTVSPPWERPTSYTLSGYVDVGGLQMPTIVKFEGQIQTARTSYRFNVGYDERVFSQPPRQLGRVALDAWERTR
jgi:hypothetical protein